ncbi:glycosyltransferase 87 family protein, partial [Rhodococcus gordoniae]
AFLLLFLLRRDRRTSATIIASTFGFTALAFAVMPATSAKYWLDTCPTPAGSARRTSPPTSPSRP